MDPGHRGWPPPGGNTHGNAEQNQSQPSRPPFGAGGQQSPPQNQTHPNLPPPNPGAPFPHFNQQPPPSLAGIASISQSSPRQPQPAAARPDGPGLPLPGFSHATGQPGVVERERERAREQEQIQIKEEEDRRREQQERQRFEQAPPHQGPPGPPMQLHQPVAVGPRTALGPNGVLNNPLPSAPQPQPQLPMGAPTGPANIFAGGAVQPAGQPQGPSAQAMQAGMLMPFAHGAQPQQTPQQQQQPQGQQGQAQGQGQQPILNDALSYLDQVKVQFSDQPDVYNRFLDIMKDFKSGAIDTPGVIGRVSSLFAGNPDLIQGFNTFLPPGYRIECGADNDPNSIRVTTPMGVSFHKMPPQRPLSQQGNAEPFGVGRINGTHTPQPGQQSAQMAFSPSGRPLGPTAQGQQPQHLSPMEAARQQEQQAMHQQQERGLGSLQNAISAATGAGLRAGVSPRGTPLPGQQDPSGGDQQAGMEKRGPVEFNHAISYVNKIKNRFSAHPDIYKQFLEILQTYQRESKPIQEVYSQVTRLFNGAPDLLEDFKQFLPESAAQAKEAERARQRAEESGMLSNVRGEYQSPVMSREAPIGTPSHGRANLPPVGNFAPTPNYKDNKRKRGDRQGTAGSANEGPPGPSAGKNGGYGGQPGKRAKQAHQQAGAKANDQPVVSPTLIPPLPAPLPPTTTTAATAEDLALFDRAKKLIGNKNIMSEFLKLCNLFCQDLIDRNTLIFRMQSFIGGNPDLLKAFRDWVGADERNIMVENKAREPMVPGGRISLSNCRGLGPSYRLLPKRERVKPCSGRDELCNSVLNDEWASHPTWASEDSGFIAHRKNVHEEGLHRIEEERHDYDLNIEACARTIQLLEPFAAQLQRMSEREIRAFQLPEKLGGQSDTIYKRVIMKCYGRERGADCVRQLHEIPGAVLPVLLVRLKERLESWKMAQREWEKVWREQTQRMFWKSLDHQAANAKIVDRRQFQTKALQSEIQVRYEEAKQEEARNMGSMAGKAQLEQKVDDIDIVVDTTYLLLVYLEAQGSTTENPRLAPFVREFVPSFFRLDPAEFETKLRQKLGGTPTNGDAVNEPFSGAEDATTEKRGRKSMKGSNLQRQMFNKKNRGGMMESPSVSRASTPDVASNAGDGETVDVEMAGTPAPEDAEGKVATSVESQSGRRWLDHPTEQNEIGGRNVDPNAPEKRTVFRLWANTPMFCFVRMFMTLYERLLKLKNNEAECRDSVAHAAKLKPANDLGIQDKEPNEFFGDTSPTANYYAQMLKKFAQVLEGEIEFGTDGVEECLRRFYLQDGYPLYALEKIVIAMARYGTQVVTHEGGNKEKSWEILQAWYKHGRKEEVGAREMTDYRRAVEKMIGSGGEGYGVDWDDERKLIRIFLWKKDDPYFSGEPHSARSLENAWRYYIASYTSIDDTSTVDRSLLSPVILLRNLHAMGADPKADNFPLSFNSGTLASVNEGTASSDQEQGEGTIAPSVENPTTTTTETNSDAVANKLLTRFLASKNQEHLTLRIAVNNYHPIFTPNTAEAFFMPGKEREGSEGGVRDVEVSGTERRALVQEKFLLMNEGMRGLSREEVEGRNGGFARLADTGEEQGSLAGEGVGEGEGVVGETADVEMAE